MRTKPAPVEPGDRPVSEVMSKPAVAVREHATMADTLRAFAVAGLRHLAIVDEQGHCVGMIGDRVVAASWAHDPLTFPSLPLSMVMDDRQPLVREGASISDAARTMRACGVDAVVVIDQRRRPVGVLTAGDLVALLAEPHAATRGG